MFGDVVLKVPMENFRDMKDNCLRTNQNLTSVQKTAKCWLPNLKRKLEKEVTLPYEPKTTQLAINVVFDSFNNPRAKYHRKKQGIDDNTGTAVNIQAMVLEIWMIIQRQVFVLREIQKRDIKFLWRMVASSTR